MTIHSLFKL